MAQHDYNIANQSGLAFRADLNNALAAIVSQNSGATEPSTTYAYQWWADTTTGLLKLRNAANNAWITIGTLASTNLGLAPLASPSFTGTATFAGDVLMSGTGQLDLPAGTTAQRSGSPNSGMIRFNTTLGQFEGYNGTAWSNIVLDSAGRALIGVSSANTNGGILQLSSGITFPATQVLSTDPNTLDDYEEGTWTPVLQDQASNSSTMSVQQGFYTKVGNTVHAWFQIQWSGKGSMVSTNYYSVGGFPFTSKTNNGGYYYTSAIVASSTSASTGCLAGNTTLMIFSAPTAGPALLVSNLSASGFINCSVTYYVN